MAHEVQKYQKAQKLKREVRFKTNNFCTKFPSKVSHPCECSGAIKTTLNFIHIYKEISQEVILCA